MDQFELESIVDVDTRFSSILVLNKVLRVLIKSVLSFLRTRSDISVHKLRVCVYVGEREQGGRRIVL